MLAIKFDKWLLVGVYDTAADIYKSFMREEIYSDELRDLLLSDTPKLFHDALSELVKLCFEPYNLKINGCINDTMVRSALIDENVDNDLDSCCRRMGIDRDGGLYDRYLCLSGDETDRTIIENKNKLDCERIAALYLRQRPLMNGLQDAEHLERDLLPVVLHMRKNGVRIDTKLLFSLMDEVKERLEETRKDLLMNWYVTYEISHSPKLLAQRLGGLGITNPSKTKKGAISWDADALESISHPVASLLQTQKMLEKTLATLDGSIRRFMNENGRIHPVFLPNKSPEGGTKTGRFACQSPNLQNIPSKESKHGVETYAAKMRELFLPEEGCLLGTFDYSQIEFLLLAHYAVGQQADWFRNQAWRGVDFHTLAMTATGIGDRSVIKTINYGVIYRMGKNTLMNKNKKLFLLLAEDNGVTIQQYVDKVWNMYQRKFPVINDTVDYMQRMASLQGYLRDIGGRVHHLQADQNELYKMPNYLLQGSAAAILKRGLVDAFSAGVFDVLKLHLTEHDENVVSIPHSREGAEAAVELEQCMNNSFSSVLKVPMRAVGGLGKNWGAKHNTATWREFKELYIK